MTDLMCVLFRAVGLRWIICKSFHSQASHLPIVYWRHYSYKWTFVLKECRVCRRVGGWERGSNSAVCGGLLFILIKTINQMWSEDEIHPRIKTCGCRIYPDISTAFPFDYTDPEVLRNDSPSAATICMGCCHLVEFKPHRVPWFKSQRHIPA